MSMPTIIMTPPQQVTNPRRTQANQSVSLLHSSRRTTGSTSSSNDSNQAQKRTLTRNSDSPSSLNPLVGKHSSGESSNAERWFEKSNNEAREQDFVDTDAPFFLRNSSSSEEQQQALPARTLHLGTDGSSTEDFRSVIDDLTIANKKLKRRLKKYETLQDAHPDKLFEVRVSGLSAQSKLDLEELLRKFAMDLHSRPEFPTNGYVGLVPLLTQKTTSSSSLHNDSAYASMSASGSSDTRRPKHTASRHQQHQSIHSYLHHIPEGLLPNPNPATMTERTKKKLVVKKLEELFAGKGAASNGHQQALQQQDVSHSAARADRIGRDHFVEGSREANIMKDDVPTDDNMPVEQRPTRPLDLDPHRAQVPSENLQYIRHLGFTMPDPVNQPEEDDEGFVYLNLLINMAQLHTANVTSDFVRKAVSEFSAKLELSPDGRKLRWKGGMSVTRSSSYGGESVGHESQSPRKKVKLSVDRDVRGSSSRRSQDKLAYTPLFHHKDSTGDEDSSTDMDDEVSSIFPLAKGDSSGMTSSGIRTSSGLKSIKKKHEDGPLIFYKQARFCTDLSGNQGTVQGPIYKPFAASPLGMPQSHSPTIPFEKRGPLANTQDLPEPMDLGDNPIPPSLELHFPQHSPLSVDAEDSSPMDFQVSGIGGVYPADNFSIAVQTRQVLTRGRPTRLLPPRFAKILRPDKAAIPKTELLTSRRTELQPSSLPPAMNFMQDDSLSDDGSDPESIVPESPGTMTRLVAPQPIELPYAEEESEEYESDDGSLDLLATARAIDPQAVRQRELEYDSNMAERLAEEIPAGSSAATAGGGSGFASPESGVSKRAYRKAKRDARQRILPRAQSIITNTRMSIDGSDDEQGSVRS